MRKNSLIAMLDAAPRRLLSTLLPATLLVIAGISTIPAAKAAEWYSVPPSACVAPFLYQAFPMRWHEAYLMNPADNIPTYVICPVTTNAAELAGANYSAQIYGAKMSGASSDTPQCFFGVTDQYNLSQPPYITGNARRYITALNTLTSDEFLGCYAVRADHAALRSQRRFPLQPAPSPKRWRCGACCRQGTVYPNLYSRGNRGNRGQNRKALT